MHTTAGGALPPHPQVVTVVCANVCGCRGSVKISLDPAGGAAAAIEEKDKGTLYTAHGVLMIIAFALGFPAAAFFGLGKPGNSGSWFVGHRVALGLSTLIAITAFIIALAVVDDHFRAPYAAHKALGLSAMVAPPDSDTQPPNLI